jgi:hypothetical protein
MDRLRRWGVMDGYITDGKMSYKEFNAIKLGAAFEMQYSNAAKAKHVLLELNCG